MEIAPATPLHFLVGINSGAYNCHAWSLCAITGDADNFVYNDPKFPNALNAPLESVYPLWNNVAEDDIKDGGYTALDFNAQNQVGDIIGYIKYNENGESSIAHTGIVTAVDDKGNTTQVTSKFGEGPLFQHHPRDTQYAKQNFGPPSPVDEKGRPLRIYYRIILRGQETRSTQPASATDPEQVKGNNEKN